MAITERAVTAVALHLWRLSFKSVFGTALDLWLAGMQKTLNIMPCCGSNQQDLTHEPWTTPGDQQQFDPRILEVEMPEGPAGLQ